jgi:hypothetical protein
MKIMKIIGTCIIPISLCLCLIIFGLLSCNESQTKSEKVDPYFEYKITYIVYYPTFNDTIIDTIPAMYHRVAFNGIEMIKDDKINGIYLYEGIAPCKIISQEKIAK